MPTPTIETTEHSLTLWFSEPEWTDGERALISNHRCPLCPLEAANVIHENPGSTSVLRCETLFAPYNDAEIIRAVGDQDGQLTMEPIHPQDVDFVRNYALCMR